MSVASIAGTARTYLRDFPKYFEVEQGPMNVLTIRLPHPMISPTSLQVFLGTPEPPPSTEVISAATYAWDLDDRNGLLKFTDMAALNKRVLVSGYHYTWFSDSELALHAGSAAEEVLYNTTGDVDDLDGVYVEVTAMAAVVRALVVAVPGVLDGHRCLHPGGHVHPGPPALSAGAADAQLLAGPVQRPGRGPEHRPRRVWSSSSCGEWHT